METKEERNQDDPATVILNAPTFLFAVKLTTLRPNASAPLQAIEKISLGLSSTRAYLHTCVNSPERSAKSTHCANASGDMRSNRSSGCNTGTVKRNFFNAVDADAAPVAAVGTRVVAAGEGVWKTFVRIVFRAARNVPRIVRRKPE